MDDGVTLVLDHDSTIGCILSYINLRNFGDDDDDDRCSILVGDIQ
jgi:hypothetical protein